MKANPKRKQSAAVNLGFQIAPMIDVVFVIMLFFMVMAGSVQIENRHNTQLPSRDGPPVDLDEVAIRIDDAGQVYLNDDPLDGPESKSLPELTQNLCQFRKSSAEANASMLVTIYADATARYDRVIDTLDSLTRAEIHHVTFQASAAD